MRLKTLLTAALVLAAGAIAAWLLLPTVGGPGGMAERSGRGEARPVPVELAPVERGPIERRRTFTGTLEPRAELVVAPKIAGRIEALTVDLADQVARGQVVATLDSDEYRQTVEQARAEVAVARANLAEAESLLTIAERELTRVDQLRERGVTSESQRDLAKAEQLAKQAHLAVSRAQLTRAEAALAGASIRLGYTEVAATWRGEGGERVVAERHVEEGETVAANEPLFRIVELDPILAVFHVTERDYALLEPGQPAELRTDAWPGEVFQGRVARIAPVFREASRQARVELKVDNPELRLKPGMFVRATLVLERIPDALIVPEPALTTRDGQRGVFVLGADGERVDWRPVEVGIRQGDRVQVRGAGLTGQVVTLGQQLLDDGSLVRLPEPAQAAAR
jgi:RND family efflux transporter MFP subunit